MSGDVYVAHVEGGRVEAKSISGDVTVEHAGQQAPIDVALESVSGDLNLNQARGNIALKTVSAEVSANHLDATTLQSQAVSGDVSLQLDKPFIGTLTTNTVSGDVSLHFPNDSNFRFTLATQSGSLACDLAATDGAQSDTLRTGTIGTGAGTVTVQTLSGDVLIGPLKEL